jgi:hypothetical protein
MAVIFKWNKPIGQIITGVLGDDKTALFAAETWHRLYDKFVPMDSGSLAHDAVDHYVEKGVGIIHHKAPYAYRQYEGESFNFSTEKHPLATARWDEAAKQAGLGATLAKDIQNYIKRGG